MASKPTTPASGKKKRNIISINKKYEVIKDYENGMTRRQLMDKYGLKTTTIQDLLKAKDKVKEAMKEMESGKEVFRMRRRGLENIDEAVYKCYTQERAEDVPVCGVDVQHDAQRLAGHMGRANFKCSNGWLWRFRQRHSIVNKAITSWHGHCTLQDASSTESIKAHQQQEEQKELPHTKDDEQKKLPHTKNDEQKKLPHTKDDEHKKLPHTKDDEHKKLPHTKDDEQKELPHTKDDEQKELPHTKDDEQKELPHTKEDTGEASKRKRTLLSLQDKIDLLDKFDQGANATQICSEYGIAKQTLYDIRKSKNKLHSFIARSTPAGKTVSKLLTARRKTMTTGRYAKLEEALWDWYQQQVSRGVIVKQEGLRMAAEMLATSLKMTNFKASFLWLFRFRRRHGISIRLSCDKSADALQEGIRPTDIAGSLPSLGQTSEEVKEDIIQKIKTEPCEGNLPQVSDTIPSPHNREASAKSTQRKKRSSVTAISQMSTDVVNMKPRMNGGDDSRKKFLMSLLPDIHAMTDVQMRKFRKLVLHAVDTVLDEPFNNTHTDSFYTMNRLSSHPHLYHTVNTPSPCADSYNTINTSSFVDFCKTEDFCHEDSYNIPSSYSVNDTMNTSQHCSE